MSPDIFALFHEQPRILAVTRPDDITQDTSLITVGAYNIRNAYGGDNPTYLAKVVRCLMQQTEPLALSWLLNLPADEIAEIPHLLVRALIAETLLSEEAVTVAEATEGAVKKMELARLFLDEHCDGIERYEPLYLQLLDAFSGSCIPEEVERLAEQEERILRSWLPESRMIREQDLWQARAEKVAAVVERNFPAGGFILTLQEANPDQVDFLKERLTRDMTWVSRAWQTGYKLEEIPRDEHRDNRRENGHGYTNTIAFDSNRFEQLEVAHRWLSETPDEPSTPPQGSWHHRLAQAVLLRDSVTERTIAVFNVHVDAKSRAQAFCIDRINEFTRDVMELWAPNVRIETGDYNLFEGRGGEELCGRLLLHPKIPRKRYWKGPFYALPFQGRDEFLGFPSGKRPNYLVGEAGSKTCDHHSELCTMWLDPAVEVRAAGIDPGLFDPETDMLLPLTAPTEQIEKAVEEKNCTSDHSYLYVTIDVPSE